MRNELDKLNNLLYDCPSLFLLPGMPPVRLLITTHPATDEPPKVGKQRDGLVYELFMSTVPAPALSPPPAARAPVHWRDWPRCQMRRQWITLVRSQIVEVNGAMPVPSQEGVPPVMTRSQRAHWRLSWQQRLERNARPASSFPVTITLHGLPVAFAHHYGFSLCELSSVSN